MGPPAACLLRGMMTLDQKFLQLLSCFELYPQDSQFVKHVCYYFSCSSFQHNCSCFAFRGILNITLVILKIVSFRHLLFSAHSWCCIIPRVFPCLFTCPACVWLLIWTGNSVSCSPQSLLAQKALGVPRYTSDFDKSHK